MNRVTLLGRLTRDPELRSLASGKQVATFTVMTEQFVAADGETRAVPRTEYHPCIAWTTIADAVGRFFSKGQTVLVDGFLQTRQWDDDAGKRHWKTEVVATSVDVLSPKTVGSELRAILRDPGLNPSNRDPATLARDPEIVKAVLEALTPA